LIIVNNCNTNLSGNTDTLEKGKLKGMFVSGSIPSGAEYKAALQDILQAFPYFQLAQVLFAKQMYDTHEPEASGRIKLASVYAPDRKAMYMLFKSTGPQSVAETRPLQTDTIKTSEKGEVKYNFVYSSTTGDNIGVTHTPPKKESETPSLSETFLRKELEPENIVPTPSNETVKVEPVAEQKVEDKKPELPKSEPIISLQTPADKIVPVEKKTEVKITETPVAPAKKPYTPPTIEKKRSLYKNVPPVVKPVITAKPPVEKTKPVIEKKPEEKKPEPILTEAVKKPYSPPSIEKKRSLYEKKVVEKKPEELKTEPPVIEKPPVEKSIPVVIIEEKAKEKSAQPEKIATAEVITPVIIESPVIIEEKLAEPEKAVTIKESAPVVIEAPIIIELSALEEKKIETESNIPDIPKVEPVVIHEPIVDSNLKYSFSSWLKVIPEISVEKKQEKKPVSQEETSDIIAKFLKKEPSISRPKAEFFSPVKAAKMSITEDESIVSETLAKIYLEQGNLAKALKAYQTLLLQLPEKKNIFAPRIEKIKALIRENTKPGTK
jgi:hypothetical protein